LDVLGREPALEAYLIYDTRQLEDAAKDLLRDFETAESNIRKLEFDLNVQKRDIARLEKQESHKYQDKQDELEAIHTKCQTLERRLSRDFAGFLASISDGRSKPVSGEEKTYHSEVAKYLGTKLGTVRHLNNEYAVRLVDLHKGEITTEKGKVIRLSDMGTGQTQSAYLKSLLETDDARKVIALFDEVATMDSQSLELVCDRLRKLHSSGRLLVGMIARIGDSVKVVPLNTAGAR
jgi:exonuclease SbcC